MLSNEKQFSQEEAVEAVRDVVSAFEDLLKRSKIEKREIKEAFSKLSLEDREFVQSWLKALDKYLRQRYDFSLPIIRRLLECMLRSCSY